MKDLMKIINSRRAVRKYKDKEVDRNIIDLLIDAGRMAPSGMNLQPWKFYIVTEKDTIDEMDDQICLVVKDLYTQPGMIEFLRKKNPIFHGAPVVIFITAPRENDWAALDIGMCAQNIMLSAKAAGLDTCPVGLGKFIERTSLYSQLHILDSEQVMLSLTIGYGDENPVMHERRKDNVFYIRSGITSRVHAF